MSVFSATVFDSNVFAADGTVSVRRSGTGLRVPDNRAVVTGRVRPRVIIDDPRGPGPYLDLPEELWLLDLE